MWPCPRLAIRPDAAQGEVTLMCPDTSAVHHPPSTEWAPMRREWPPAAAFLSDRAGIALAALDPCVHSQGMPQLGAVSPKPAQPLYWSQSPWLWPLTHCQGSWPAWPWDESLWGKCLALDPWYLTVSRLVGWLINLLLSLNQYFPTEAFLGSLSLSLKTNLFYLMCMSALPVCMYVYYMCVCMCTACVYVCVLPVCMYVYCMCVCMCTTCVYVCVLHVYLVSKRPAEVGIGSLELELHRGLWATMWVLRTEPWCRGLSSARASSALTHWTALFSAANTSHFSWMKLYKK
jgi:hypothetical protein